MVYRALVVGVSSAGVFVEVPGLAPGMTFGPCQRIGSAPSVDDIVAVADVGDGIDPDLIVLGGLT